MSQPYVGEIRLFAGSFAPAGWMFCSGQLLPISENETLFQLIGTTYGGDGQSTFALPDLQSRVPIHQGTDTASNVTYQLAEVGGTESVTLTVQQIPSHTHVPTAGAAGGVDSPVGNIWGASTTGKPYVTGNPTLAMNAGDVTATGGSQPHDNNIPTLTVSYIISLFGIFPSQSGGNGGSNPFLGQVNIFSFIFAPGGWAQCNGQFLPINQNQALFSLMGTMYGGNGQTTFALPDLRGRTAFHSAGSIQQGQRAGQVSHTLAIAELPAHSHPALASTQSPSVNTPTGNTWASNTGFTPYASYGSPMVLMNPASITSIGGSQPHNNMAPYLVLNFCVALQGIFPSQS